MVQINFGQREVSCKVVFYGPGMSGKTTNLEIIHKKAPKEAVGDMVSIATETDRTLYFDFLPLDLGQVAGMRTKFQLYTVPGQIYYNATRKLVLQGVDGVIFVADSAPDKMPENLESLQNLRDNLTEMGLTIDDPTAANFVPVVLQYNKRDLPNAQSVADMNAQMNPLNYPIYEACARDGKGVFGTLKEASRLVIERLNKEHAPGSRGRRTGANLTPQGQATVGATPGTPATPATPPAATPPASPVAPTPPRPLPVAPNPPQPQRPLPGAGATHTPSRGSPVLRAPAPPAPPPAPPRPPAAPPRSAYNPTAPTPAMGTPTTPPNEPASLREKHLAKAKPPALGKRGPGGPDLGATDPNLKKFQQSTSGGGTVKTLLIVLLFVVIAVILLVGLAIFVPAVRALLPQNWQQAIEGSAAPATPAPAPVAPVAPVAAPATPAPATPAPAAPAVPAEKGAASVK
jgi:signal recognition particle receptor subunit beta